MRALFTCQPGSGGTVQSVRRGREILPKVLEGLSNIDAEFVVTIGRDLDPAVLAPQPANIHVERFLPLGALLARCSLVVYHGGSGTLGHAIAHGLPMVTIPLGADMPENAARSAELGVSRSLDPEELAPDAIRSVVLDVLQTPSYRQKAERLREEFEGLPGVETAVELLGQLSREKRSILATR